MFADLGVRHYERTLFQPFVYVSLSTHVSGNRYKCTSMDAPNSTRDTAFERPPTFTFLVLCEEDSSDPSRVTDCWLEYVRMCILFNLIA